MYEIGRRLRAAREAKGLSLEVVEEETKIRRKYVEALESGQEAVLPGDAYLKGFLRTYGNYLGLDGPALVEEYKRSKERPVDSHGPVSASAQRQGGSAHPATVQEREARREEARYRSAESLLRETGRLPEKEADYPVERPVTDRPEVRRAPRPRRPMRKESGSLRTLGMTAVVLALIGAVAYLGWLIFTQTTPPQPEPQPPAPPPVATTQPEPTPAPALPDPPKVTMSQANQTDVVFAVPAKEITVKLEIGGNRVWYEATVDGKKEEGTLTASKELKGADIRVRIGHMEGVSLVVNGQRFEKPLQGGPYNLVFKGQ
ncbi:MAG TPA: helix-turn-helix domain-containing protein [Symbiobacteriaceae bacterium]|nr:helix-turn-helix domain-containing protein [Symbiobacteriaceae bacterium]